MVGSVRCGGSTTDNVRTRSGSPRARWRPIWAPQPTTDEMCGRNAQKADELNNICREVGQTQTPTGISCPAVLTRVDGNDTTVTAQSSTLSASRVEGSEIVVQEQDRRYFPLLLVVELNIVERGERHGSHSINRMRLEQRAGSRCRQTGRKEAPNSARGERRRGSKQTGNPRTAVCSAVEPC